MLLSDFDFELPPELIAQEPLPDRSSSHMLALDRSSGSFRDERFVDLPSHLHAGDVLVLNNSRVFPARLLGRRSGQRAQPTSPRNPAARDFLQGEIEVLLVRQLGNNEWESLVRPGRKLGIGEMLRFGSDESGAPLLEAEIVERGEFGERCLRFRSVPDFFARLEKIGHTPLPPYIGREDQSSDRERYQTVFASQTGSAAAPTAGLHFTPEILDRIRARQVRIAEITLHVGLGTFQPLRHARVEENALHVENYELFPEAAQTINSALAEGRRIVAVGTTVIRALEHLARQYGGRLAPGLGETDIFIYPGFQFRVVRAMLTNFHLPQSSLLMLVSAFAGREHVLAAYRHAVDSRYRFFSYGDCMWIE
ncbi:MAG TPA: tRNA preQ1(34) S-adenosylmethionine ribosyltransferase-isomerase QueA [Terriglobales bacterium]|nr:tRNA preQ1(34) S-adenosylmethionine ribosyltransferase-isomerase QueA [Terriglobales bacterium]